jgi:hypothetical protein
VGYSGTGSGTGSVTGSGTMVVCFVTRIYSIV